MSIIYNHTDDDGETLRVYDRIEHVAPATVAVVMENTQNEVFVTTEQAPALALAILEATGYTDEPLSATGIYSPAIVALRRASEEAES